MQAIAETKERLISQELEEIGCTLQDCLDDRLEGPALFAARTLKEELSNRPFGTKADQKLMFAANLVCLSIDDAANTLHQVISDLFDLVSELEKKSL